MKNIFLTVIIPCYNESENIKKGVLKDVYDYLKNVEYSWEAIISDDGSTDESTKLIKERINKFQNFRLIKNPHGGKPSALKYGIDHALGKYVLFSDLDQSTPINQLDRLLPFVEDGYKAVIGSRGMQRKNFPVYRKLGSIIFSSFRKMFILREINDTQCGFKLFDRTLAIEAFPKLEYFRKNIKVKGWKVTSWDVELLHIMNKMGINIAEVEVEWKSEDDSANKGGQLSRYIKESWEMLFQIIRVKINDIWGFYTNFKEYPTRDR